MIFFNSLLSAFAYSCPLILCSLGALFSEFAGCLALFLDGLVSFSAFLFYTFTVTTGSPLAGAIRPAIRDRSVDLPQPLGPTIATNSPLFI